MLDYDRYGGVRRASSAIENIHHVKGRKLEKLFLSAGKYDNFMVMTIMKREDMVMATMIGKDNITFLR